MANTAKEQFLKLVKLCGPRAGEEGPVIFATQILKKDLDPWQEETLRAYGRGERQMSIRACHGPGKTFTAAICILHQLVFRFPQNTVATAPTVGQLEDALVKEVMTLFSELPQPIQSLYEVKKNRIELKAAPSQSFFAAKTARDEKPEALQGVHCEEGWVLLLADEAPGVGEKIFEAAGGSMSGTRVTTLLLGNPTRTSGFFFNTHTRWREKWWTRVVSADDSSRVSDEFKQEMADRYGEDSDQYRVRVLGEFPKTDTNTIIPFGLCDQAQRRSVEPRPDIRPVWGLDVARFGDDANALVKRDRSRVWTDIKTWQGKDLMQTANRVLREWNETVPSARPSVILVDGIGLGAGVADRLREQGLPVRSINVSETSLFPEKYRNVRAQLWFECLEWLETLEVGLPQCKGGCPRDCPHEKLVAEMTTPEYTITPSGKYQVESKSDMKKRGHKSPNIADALMLTFAEIPAAMVHGSRGGHSSWDEPISRSLSTV